MQKINWCLAILCLMANLYAASSFDEMMGNVSLIETQEDRIHYAAFKKSYELKDDSNTTQVLPKILHLVWLGENAIPKKMRECICSWLKYHPSWEMNLWTNAYHTPPDPKINCQSIEKIAKQLPPFFSLIDNVGVQSYLVRLCLLNEYGGVTLDVDVECRRSIDELCHGLDFLGSALFPEQLSLSSSVYLGTYLIGAKPKHPIIEETLAKTIKQWDEVEACFPENDAESYAYRSDYHTYPAFTHAFIKTAGKNDVVFPAQIFSSKGKLKGIYSHHYGKKTWAKNRSDFEALMTGKLIDLDQEYKDLKIQASLLFWSLLSILILMGIGGIFFAKNKKNLAK